jgi:hypothetical protein
MPCNLAPKGTNMLFQRKTSKKLKFLEVPLTLIFTDEKGFITGNPWTLFVKPDLISAALTQKTGMENYRKAILPSSSALRPLTFTLIFDMLLNLEGFYGLCNF